MTCCYLSDTLWRVGAPQFKIVCRAHELELWFSLFLLFTSLWGSPCLLWEGLISWWAPWSDLWVFDRTGFYFFQKVFWIWRGVGILCRGKKGESGRCGCSWAFWGLGTFLLLWWCWKGGSDLLLLGWELYFLMFALFCRCYLTRFRIFYWFWLVWYKLLVSFFIFLSSFTVFRYWALFLSVLRSFLISLTFLTLHLPIRG